MILGPVAGLLVSVADLAESDVGVSLGTLLHDLDH